MRKLRRSVNLVGRKIKEGSTELLTFRLNPEEQVSRSRRWGKFFVVKNSQKL